MNLVGSIKLWVSLAKEPYKSDNILQKRPVILSILLNHSDPIHIDYRRVKVLKSVQSIWVTNYTQIRVTNYTDTNKSPSGWVKVFTSVESTRHQLQIHTSHELYRHK